MCNWFQMPPVAIDFECFSRNIAGVPRFGKTDEKIWVTLNYAGLTLEFRNLGCSRCVIFGVWIPQDVGFRMLEMLDVRDEKGSGCGMFGI